MRRGRTLVLAAGTVALATVGVWTLARHDGEVDEAVAAESVARETAEVTRGDLTSDYDHSGQVDFGEEWPVPLQAGGTVTSVRPEGTVVRFGEELLRVDDQPLFLAQGGYPMYRELALRSDEMVGFDVLQLQRFLLAAGFDDDGDLAEDGVFGTSTRDALRDWQESVGLAETGRIGPSTILFNEAPVRIASELRLGATFDGLQLSPVDPAVTVTTDADGRVGLPLDGVVTVELADGTTVEGTVTDHTRQIADDGSVSYVVTITPRGSLGDAVDGQTSVAVHSTVVEAEDVLRVPTSALLAVAGGGFALEVVDGAGGTRLVPVEVGEVIDATAEIIGDVAAGEHVVVPT